MVLHLSDFIFSIRLIRSLHYYGWWKYLNLVKKNHSNDFLFSIFFPVTHHHHTTTVLINFTIKQPTNYQTNHFSNEENTIQYHSLHLHFFFSPFLHYRWNPITLIPLSNSNKNTTSLGLFTSLFHQSQCCLTNKLPATT